MDVFTFVSNLVKSLAWPVTVVTLALVFRNRLGALLDRLIELRFHKVSFKLEGASKALNQVRGELHLPQVQLSHPTERTLARPVGPTREVSTVERPVPFQLKVSEAPQTDPLKGAPVSDPSVEFELAWQSLQADLLKKARQFGATRLRKAESAADYLEEKSAVPTAFLAAFEQVQEVYDAAKKHPNSPIDSELASEFKWTCVRLRLYLAQIGP